MTARSPDSARPGPRSTSGPPSGVAGIPSAVIPGWAIRHWPNRSPGASGARAARPRRLPARRTDPGPPAQAPARPAARLRVAGQRLHGDLAVEARQPRELLADDGRLQPRCAGRLACCQSQPPQPPGDARTGRAARPGPAKRSGSPPPRRGPAGMTSVTRAGPALRAARAGRKPPARRPAARRTIRRAPPARRSASSSSGPGPRLVTPYAGSHSRM